jgi:hypothetical protein
MATKTNESTKEIVKKRFLIFRHYQMDVKEIIYPFQWWEKHEVMFSIIGFLACQIFRIIGSQINKLR